MTAFAYFATVLCVCVVFWAAWAVVRAVKPWPDPSKRQYRDRFNRPYGVVGSERHDELRRTGR